MSRSSYFPAPAPALLALAAALLSGASEATAEPEDERPSLLRRLKPRPPRAAAVATAPTPDPLAPAPVLRYTPRFLPAFRFDGAEATPTPLDDAPPIDLQLSRTQFETAPGPWWEAPDSAAPDAVDPDTGAPYSSIFDPPIDYSGPSPAAPGVEDEEHRDGPRIPEPMVFDLVRGLGARKGELEFNVLALAPFRRYPPRFEWAPEVEYVLFDGFAVEYEIPIFDTQIVAHKFGAQYTFGTALDDAFIHGVQGLGYFDTVDGKFIPTVLYLAGLRLDERWSLFGMFGMSVGPQTFPFADVPERDGVDIITNLSLFFDVTDRLVLGVETNLSRQLGGPSEFLFMPQLHYELNEHLKTQFGMGLRDDSLHRYGELGFRIIFER